MAHNLMVHTAYNSPHLNLHPARPQMFRIWATSYVVSNLLRMFLYSSPLTPVAVILECESPSRICCYIFCWAPFDHSRLFKGWLFQVVRWMIGAMECLDWLATPVPVFSPIASRPFHREQPDEYKRSQAPLFAFLSLSTIFGHFSPTACAGHNLFFILVGAVIVLFWVVDPVCMLQSMNLVWKSLSWIWWPLLWVLPQLCLHNTLYLMSTLWQFSSLTFNDKNLVHRHSTRSEPGLVASEGVV